MWHRDSRTANQPSGVLGLQPLLGHTVMHVHHSIQHRAVTCSEDPFLAASLWARAAKLPFDTLPPPCFAPADWICAAALPIIPFDFSMGHLREYSASFTEPCAGQNDRELPEHPKGTTKRSQSLDMRYSPTIMTTATAQQGQNSVYRAVQYLPHWFPKGTSRAFDLRRAADPELPLRLPWTALGTGERSADRPNRRTATTVRAHSASATRATGRHPEGLTVGHRGTLGRTAAVRPHPHH